MTIKTHMTQQVKIQAVKTKKSYWKKLFLISLPVFIFLFSFFIGRYPIYPLQLIQIIGARIFHYTHPWPEIMNTIVFNIRIPRIIAAMMVGSSLAVAGASYQGMFKNPLVSPDILGVSAGAGFGAAIGIFLSFNMIKIQFCALCFGLIAVSCSCLISSKIRHDPMLALVLSGLIIGTLFTSAISLIKYVADPYDKLPAITFWLMGSLGSISKTDLYAIIPMILGIIPIYLIRWRINVLALGDEEANSLGLNTKKLKLVIIFCSTLVTAAAVSISGMIGWVGLMVPHLARMIVGPNYKILIPASSLIGGCYLLFVDDLARVIAPIEIPLGILTSSIGAPFFLYLLLRNRGGWR